jgi:pSer/pThr/pTyr-binding forkhead associated (FHA) protein
LLLRVISGAQQAAKISLRDGQVLQVGRTEWADCAFPDDLLMSSIHFSVECGTLACVVRDLKSTNGTYINGKKKREAVLSDGDEIRAGNTVFSVTIEGPAPSSSVLGAEEAGAQALKTIPDFDAEALRAQAEEAPIAERKATFAEHPAAEEPFLQAPQSPATAFVDVSRHEEPLATPKPQGPASQLVLETLSGSREGQKILLRAGDTVTVGRTERADLAIANDFQLSSIHFAIDWQAGNFRIRDLGSTNGTTLNDHLMTEAILQDRDQIRAGRTKFVVHIECETPSKDAIRQTVATSISSFSIAADADLDVRRVALWSAAWAKQAWVLDYCRRLCDDPKPEDFEAAYLLGVLGRTVDLRSIKAIGSNAMLGPNRFRTLGAYGHPEIVELIFEAIAGEEASDAASAGEAFERITGVVLDWNPSKQAPHEQTAEGPDGPPPDETPPDETLVPDVQQAKNAWEKLKPELSSCTRICRGFDLSRGCDENILVQLDMQSRYEAILRARMAGAWKGSLTDLERFPLGYAG